MRKLMALLCVLWLLPASGYAQEYVTLAVLREQAGNGWHESFTARGRDVIVQADVTWLAEADACPIPEVAGAVKAQPGPEFRKSGKALASETYVNWAWMQKTPWLDRSGSTFCSPVRYTVYGGETPPLIPDGLDIGYEELLARIDQDVAPYTDVRLADFRIREVEVEGILYAPGDALTDGTQAPGEVCRSTGSYRLEAVQLLRGIPLVESRTTRNGTTPGGGLDYYYFSRDWRYYHLYCTREVATLQEDVPLLSFGDMKRIWMEQIAAGKLRGIDGLEFGYVVCWSDGRFIALPAWRLKGGYTADPHRERVMPYHSARDEDGSLTVPETYGDHYYNAQTGDMLPAVREGVRTLENTVILTWEDIQ